MRVELCRSGLKEMPIQVAAVCSTFVTATFPPHHGRVAPSCEPSRIGAQSRASAIHVVARAARVVVDEARGFRSRGQAEHTPSSRRVPSTMPPQAASESRSIQNSRTCPFRRTERAETFRANAWEVGKPSHVVRLNTASPPTLPSRAGS